MHYLPVILNANLITLISVVIALLCLIIVHLPFMHRCTIIVYLTVYVSGFALCILVMFTK
jgi:hypothetical protein